MSNKLFNHEGKAPLDSSSEKRFNTSGQATAELISELKKRSIDSNHPSQESNK